MDPRSWFDQRLGTPISNEISTNIWQSILDHATVIERDQLRVKPSKIDRTVTHDRSNFFLPRFSIRNDFFFFRSHVTSRDVSHKSNDWNKDVQEKSMKLNQRESTFEWHLGVAIVSYVTLRTRSDWLKKENWLHWEP